MGSEGRIMLRDLVTEMIKLIWGILTGLPLRLLRTEGKQVVKTILDWVIS